MCLSSDASCNTYHLTSVSLTLNEGYLLTAAPPDLECGVAPLGPPVPAQPPLLGCGVKEVIPCLAGDETTGSGLGETGQRGRPDPAGFTLQKYENTVENGNAAVPGGLGRGQCSLKRSR